MASMARAKCSGVSAGRTRNCRVQMLEILDCSFPFVVCVCVFVYIALGLTLRQHGEGNVHGRKHPGANQPLSSSAEVGTTRMHR